MALVPPALRGTLHRNPLPDYHRRFLEFKSSCSFRVSSLGFKFQESGFGLKYQRAELLVQVWGRIFWGYSKAKQMEHASSTINASAPPLQ